MATRRTPPEGIDDLRAMAAALEQDDIEGARAIIEAAVILPRVTHWRRTACSTPQEGARRGVQEIIARRHLEPRRRQAAALRPRRWRRRIRREGPPTRRPNARGSGRIVEELANRRDLIDHAADIAQALGVVGERKAIKANYIAMSSRMLGEQRVLSVVDTGVSSAGKSHLMNTVARIFPPECIEVITSGSPKSLVFMVRRRPPRAVAQDHSSGRDRRVHRRVRHRLQPFGRAGARHADRRRHHLGSPRKTTRPVRHPQDRGLGVRSR